MDILIVDDNQMTRHIVSRHLTRLGNDVREAGDGDEALNHIAHQKPGLVLLELILPGMNGIELCQKLRQNPEFDDMRIVLLTADSGIEGRLDKGHSGFDGFLVKPFEPRALDDCVRGFLST